MKDFWETVMMLLASLAMLAGGVLALVYGEGGKPVAGGVFAIVLGTAFAFGMVCVIVRDAKAGTLFPQPKYYKHEQAMQGEEMEAVLPFPLLHEQFGKLAQKDDLASAEEGFLSWNNGSGCSIRIHSMGGDAWVAPCELNRYTTLQGKDITALCRRHKIKLADRSAIFNALAFYRDGKLTVYPKSMAGLFAQEWRDPDHGAGILTTGDTFARWLKEYTDEG